MKKQLLSLFAAMTVGSVLAQTPSPSWTINQQAVFPTPSNTNASQGIKYMDAVDANVVWTIGMDYNFPNRNYNWFSRTTNGGNSWNGGNIFSDTNNRFISNMEGIDANTAWVAAYLGGTLNLANPGQKSSGVIYNTTNGGSSWNNMTATGMFTNSTSFANFVSFFTPSVGIVNGDPVNGEFEIWRTTNGGASWSLTPGANIPNPLSGEFAIVNLYYKLGTSYLWFGTNAGRMYRTADAGLTWSVSPVSVSTTTLLEIAFSSPNNGICTLFDGSATQLWQTTDGGINWTQITTIDPDFGFADIVNIPGTGLLASFGVGGNSLLSYSSDNGVTWTNWGSSNIQYLTGDFVNGSTGWAGSQNLNGFTNVWKYSGATITGTVAPTSAFGLAPFLCISGPSATYAPTNSSAGSATLTYSWAATPGGASFSSNTAATPTITFTSGNTYTITLTVTNALGSNTSTQVINVQACSAPNVNFSVASLTACTNVPFTATNTSSGGAPAPSYSWVASSGGTITPSSVVSTPSFAFANPGTYSITLIGTNSQGTVGSTQVVTVTSCAPLANFSIPASMYRCYKTSTFVTLTTTNNTQANSSAGANSYTWSINPTSGVQNLTGLTLVNYSAKLTHSLITTYTVTLRAKNASGTSTLSQVLTIDTLCLSVNLYENSSLENNVSVFPNPAHDQVTVKIASAGTEAHNIRIINVLGAVVYDEKIARGSKESVSISLAGKPKGVYFVTVENGSERTTRKIIIE